MGRLTYLNAVLSAGLLYSASIVAAFEAPSPGPATDSNPGPRPWDASIRVSYGRDSNVALVPEISSYTGTKDSGVMAINLSGVYRVVQSTDLTVGLTGAVSRAAYSEGKGPGDLDSPDEYDLTVYNSGIFVERHLRLWNRPARLGANYDYNQENLRIDDLASTNHRFGFNGSLQATPRLEILAAYYYSNFESDTEFPTPSLDSRDAKHQSLSVSAVYSLSALRKIVFTLANSDNNADGDNFDYDATVIGARFETRVSGPVWLALGASKDMRDYNGFVSGFIPPPGRTDQDVMTYTAQLVWTISRQLSADFYVDQTSYDANQLEFEADRSKTGAAITWKFK